MCFNVQVNKGNTDPGVDNGTGEDEGFKRSIKWFTTWLKDNGRDPDRYGTLVEWRWRARVYMRV